MKEIELESTRASACEKTWLERTKLERSLSVARSISTGAEVDQTLATRLSAAVDSAKCLGIKSKAQRQS